MYTSPCSVPPLVGSPNGPTKTEPEPKAKYRSSMNSRISLHARLAPAFARTPHRTTQTTQTADTANKVATDFKKQCSSNK